MSTSGFCPFLALLQLTGLLFSLKFFYNWEGYWVLEERSCRKTVQGKYLISDDEGNVCDVLSLDSRTRCCRWKGELFPYYSLLLLHHSFAHEYLPQTLLQKVVKGHTNLYLILPGATAIILRVWFMKLHTTASFTNHHCFSLTSNASGANLTQVETRLLGIDVTVRREGDSYDAVCKSHGQLCVVNKLSLLNQYVTCRLPESYGTLQRDAPPVQLLPHNPEPPATTTATGDATAFPEQPKQHNVGLVQAAKQHFHCQKEVKKLN